MEKLTSENSLIIHLPYSACVENWLIDNPTKLDYA